MRKSGFAVIFAVALSGCISQSRGPELRAVNANPIYSREQAHAICYAEAMNADAGYSVQTPTSKTMSFGFPTSVDTNCTTVGSFTSCHSTPSGGGGGFASGFAEAYAKETARRESRPPRADTRSVYFACLAKIGYVKA